MRRRLCLRSALLGILTMCATPAYSDALVAVAANFSEVAARLAHDFHAQSGHNVRFSIGSTGQFYAQIARGAPYDVLLAADQARVARLEASGLAVPGSRFTYARGRLVLWSADSALIDSATPARAAKQLLRAGTFRNLAIANPELAPYGQAAKEVLDALGLGPNFHDRLAIGQNIGQVFSMVATGNAELGFVALSYVRSQRNRQKGSAWEVPTGLHAPILQDAVLLLHGEKNEVAVAFLRYLKSAEAKAQIVRFGYEPS
ncbi:MAG: molybdate ABC transporter substrate-binding protein [Gammaproteobacteria bacterium]|nr:molybdate ABC transporter substrate-binding protein [Gammaproteobacteria bacterium]